MDTKAGEHDMIALYSWISDNGDPDNFLTHNLGCASVGVAGKSRWCDKDSTSHPQKTHEQRRNHG